MMVPRCLLVLCVFLSLCCLAQAFSAPTVQLKKVELVWQAEPSEQAEASAIAPQQKSTESSKEDEKQSSHVPPVIQEIVDERRQYQMNLGKAMDVLRKDMQDILTKQPGTPFETSF